MLERFVKEVNKRKLRLDGVRVLQNGKLLEEYRWIPEEPRLIHSCSKAFTSVAAGLAICEGLFDLEDSVIERLELPEYAEEWSGLKVKHLLTMSSGHAEGTLLFEERGKIEDWQRAFFEKKRKFEPGTIFVYNNGCSYLISALIQKCSGEKLSDFLGKSLFLPMGWEMPNWAECPHGRTQGLSGLYLTTSQMAEFGQLLLDGGKKDGVSLIPEDWIRRATEKHITTFADGEPDWSCGYGYFFWRSQHDCWRADGMLGQFIIVLERLNAVIAINSNDARMQSILNRVWKYILPTLEENCKS